MLGYTGEFQGRPVSVQATGMGCPSAAIVIEELVQLGVKRLLRVGTCGGLQPNMTLGDLIVLSDAFVPEPDSSGSRFARAYETKHGHAPSLFAANARFPGHGSVTGADLAVLPAGPRAKLWASSPATGRRCRRSWPSGAAPRGHPTRHCSGE